MLLTINPQIVTQMMTQDSTAYLTQVVRYWILVDSNLAGFERDQPNSTPKTWTSGINPVYEI